jgi:hypothetical protein
MILSSKGSSPDDEAYRRSVRNMTVVIAAVLAVLAASLTVPPLVNPVHEQFQKSSFTTSPLGFNLFVAVNTTRIASGQSVSISAWIENTMNRINNITASNLWPLGPLWTRPCTAGWPIGIGVMQGYFTIDNISAGRLLTLWYQTPRCPVSSYSPEFFLVQPSGSRAIVTFANGIQQWDLNATASFKGYIVGQGEPAPFRGVYTVVVADEWGDIALTHFSSS